ncbi:exonuclease subunit SbcD [Treponema zioleckii]|uniref:exonuclease subunit SbcD n=1 Tax=Treponema zioleckii TaxID=331680 RepID=UPI00168AC4AC|nr:exonuclease subunit SbcD [Treponema zioleckii]
MKFIHTADWHLGNKMHDIDRTKEVKFFLDWLRTQIIENGAQALVVSGDIFDTANPPNFSKTQYADFLASLQSTCCKNIVVVGGNHDSGDLLDTEKAIFKHLNIHVVGSLTNTSSDEMVFELFDEAEQPLAICAAVPFAHECELRNYIDENKETEDGTFSDRAYGALYKKILEKAESLRGKKDIPIIATGHLYAANLEGRFENQQNENRSDDGRRVLDVVGKLGSVHENIFPKEFDYVALGHIHYTTTVGKNPKIMYSGSPFVMGFDEAQIPHNVLLVEAKPGKTNVSKLKIPSIVNYRRINGDSKTILSFLEEYKKNPPEKRHFLNFTTNSKTA